MFYSFSVPHRTVLKLVEKYSYLGDLKFLVENFHKCSEFWKLEEDEKKKDKKLRERACLNYFDGKLHKNILLKEGAFSTSLCAIYCSNADESFFFHCVLPFNVLIVTLDGFIPDTHAHTYMCMHTHNICTYTYKHTYIHLRTSTPRKIQIRIHVHSLECGW